MTLKLGRQMLDETPMNLHETIMFLYLFGPYVPAFLAAAEKTVYDIVIDLLREIRIRDPLDLTRMLAMLYHVDADSFVDNTIESKDLILAIMRGFEINRLPILLEAGFRMRVF